MVDAGGLSTLVTNPKAQSWAGSAAEREAAERQRDRARHEQGLQTLEARPEGSEEWTEMIGQMWENMPWYDRAAILTAIVPGVGDVVGLGADAIALAKDPSWANLGFMGAGILPWVPAGAVLKGARKLGKKSKSQTGEEVKKDAPILSGTAQRIFTNLRNDIPGFYEGGIGKGGKGARFAKTLPEGARNAYLARYSPQWRAIQREHNISVADQKTSQHALRVSDKIDDTIKTLEARQIDMIRRGERYTGEITIHKIGKQKGKPKLTDKGEEIPIERPEYRMVTDMIKKLKSNARNATKKAMGQLNQSRSITKQYLGHDSGLEGLLEPINKVDHIKNFETFNVEDYLDTIRYLIPQGIGEEGVEQIFKQIRTLPSIGFNKNKKYQMNIRRVYTQGAGNLDQRTTKRLYSSKRIGVVDKQGNRNASLEDIKKNVFVRPVKGYKNKTELRGYNSSKEFLDALDKTGIEILNRRAMIEGIKKGNDIPAVITGSAKTDAWEIGGANYMTAINRRGQVTTIVNDEHDLLGKYGKLPGADRYMNVSEPIVVDLIKGKTPTVWQKGAKKVADRRKEKAVKQAIERYKEIPGVDISGDLPPGFDTYEQWARTQAVAKVKPTKKRQGLPWRTEGDYSRIVREGAFMPMRFAKPLLGEEDRKAGGSVMERNPYDYPPKAI